LFIEYTCVLYCDLFILLLFWFVFYSGYCVVEEKHFVAFLYFLISFPRFFLSFSQGFFFSCCHLDYIYLLSTFFFLFHSRFVAAIRRFSRPLLRLGQQKNVFGRHCGRLVANSSS